MCYVLVVMPICLFSNCSKRLFIVSCQHKTSTAAHTSLLCNHIQMAKIVSKENISALQAISLTKQSCSSTLADDHCCFSTSTGALGILEL